MNLPIIEQHFAIWSERNAEIRASEISKVYTKDIEIIDPHSVAHGYKEAQELITNLQAKFPQRSFSLRKAIEEHHNVARLFWQFGTPEQPDQVTGQDVLILENGKIRQLLIFIDPQ